MRLHKEKGLFEQVVLGASEFSIKSFYLTRVENCLIGNMLVCLLFFN